MANALLPDDLPGGFWYPHGYIRLIECGLLTLEPWHVLDGAQVQDKRSGLTERFPSRRLLPFAARQDNDDCACWDLDRGSEVVAIVHDYASPGYESRGEYATFYDWLRQAVEDFIEFDLGYEEILKPQSG